MLTNTNKRKTSFYIQTKRKIFTTNRINLTSILTLIHYTLDFHDRIKQGRRKLKTYCHTIKLLKT